VRSLAVSCFFRSPLVTLDHMQRILSLSFFAVLSVEPIANAQYIRVGNPGATQTAGLNAPTVLSSKMALYTEDARSHAIEGAVTIEAVIDENGRITSSRILKGLGFGLDQVALRIHPGLEDQSGNKQ